MSKQKQPEAAEIRPEDVGVKIVEEERPEKRGALPLDRSDPTAGKWIEACSLHHFLPETSVSIDRVDPTYSRSPKKYALHGPVSLLKRVEKAISSGTKPDDFEA